MLGTRFRVLTQDPELADRVDMLLSGFEPTSKPARAGNILQVTSSADAPYAIHVGCFRRAVGDDLSDTLPSLISILNQLVIGQVDSFATHASVVAHSEAGIVAFPAESGEGKTTIAAVAVQSGFDYLSDEALVLDDDGAVVPYPKPMALSAWSYERIGGRTSSPETLITPADLGGSFHPGGISVSHLVIARYGHNEPSLSRLPSSQAVAELLGKSFNHYKDPERAFRIATHVAKEVDVWRLDYDDPKEAIDLLVDRIT